MNSKRSEQYDRTTGQNRDAECDRAFGCQLIPQGDLDEVSERHQRISTDSGGRQNRCLHFRRQGFDAYGDVYEAASAVFQGTV
jgi:hypothetical protein